MNGKKAKKLRRYAKQLSEAVDEKNIWRDYEARQRTRSPNTMIKLMSKLPVSMSLQEKLEIVGGSSVYQIRLKSLCGRNIYQGLKQKYLTSQLAIEI